MAKTLYDLDAAPSDIEIGGKDPSSLISGTPVTQTIVQYQSPDGKTSAGLWESTPGAWRSAYDHWEFVVIEQGRCIVTSEDGTVVRGVPGTTRVFEPGYRGTWEVLETVRKRWVIREID